MPDDAADAVKALSKHHYGFAYFDSQHIACGWRMHVGVYATAKKYGAIVLKVQAVGAFRTAFNVVLGKDVLKEFYDIAHEVYTSTVPSDRGLRDVIVKKAKEK